MNVGIKQAQPERKKICGNYRSKRINTVIEGYNFNYARVTSGLYAPHLTHIESELTESPS